MKCLIWKGTLNVRPGLIGVSVPKDSTFLSIQAQDGVPTIWFRFPAANAHGETDELTIMAVMTGHEFDLKPSSFASNQWVEEVFLGTVQIGDTEALLDGPFVLHYFLVSQ